MVLEGESTRGERTGNKEEVDFHHAYTGETGFLQEKTEKQEY